ncbi:MAG TPA: hypothetical protein VJ227_04525 [Patescibacteria group bacterium]|nr:hypothetical protein [Patescibacteria group bacterium]
MELENLSPEKIVKTPGFKKWPLILGAFLVVAAGVGVGWLLSSKVINKGSGEAAPGTTVTANEAGILNPNFKYDTAVGILEEGGINGDGTHHLVREGGPSKYVYLTSSVIDLQSFVGKKVEVWGETQASKKAGWLMDVAKIQVQP